MDRTVYSKFAFAYFNAKTKQTNHLGIDIRSNKAHLLFRYKKLERCESETTFCRFVISVKDRIRAWFCFMFAGDHVIKPIDWSSHLDETFKSNYETDRSLMWQYYASTSGFLRHYPGTIYIILKLQHIQSSLICDPKTSNNNRSRYKCLMTWF